MTPIRRPGRLTPGHTRARGFARTAGAAVGAALVLAGCSGRHTGGPAEPGTGGGPTSTGGSPTAPGTAAPARFSRYVALGDSFAALGSTSSPTSGPPTCYRAADDYPGVLAADPRIDAAVDVTCGGAETPDMTGRQIPATPPQLDALTADTDLVTLSIGGNDIGYGDLARCAAGPPAGEAPCRDRLSGEVDSALAALPPALDAVHASIHARSPRARVVVTRYLPLLPASGGCAFTERLGAGDLAWIRGLEDRLDRMVTDAATRAGAAAVLPADAEAHTACAPVAAERYTDFTGLETSSHPMHPTAAGQRAVAAAVAAAL